MGHSLITHFSAPSQSDRLRHNDKDENEGSSISLISNRVADSTTAPWDRTYISFRSCPAQTLMKPRIHMSGKQTVEALTGHGSLTSHRQTSPQLSLYRQQRLIIDEVLGENKKRGRPRNKKIQKRGAQNNEESRLKKQRWQMVVCLSRRRKKPRRVGELQDIELLPSLQ